MPRGRPQAVIKVIHADTSGISTLLPPLRFLPETYLGT